MGLVFLLKRTVFSSTLIRNTCRF